MNIATVNKKNLSHKHRTPKDKDKYSPDELRKLLTYHNTGATVDDLTSVFNRSATSIRTIACIQGVSLKRNK